MSHAYRDVVARLASAAGVDPDAADPVGEIERVIREGRAPEVVSGAEAAELPVGSIISSWHAGTPYDGLARYLDGWERSGGVCHPDPLLGQFIVWHRAPVPAPAPLAVGDELLDADALRRAEAGTLVEQPNGVRGLVCGQEHHRSVHWTTGRTCSLRPGDLDWPAEAAWPMHVVYVPDDAVRAGTGGGEP